MNRFTNDNPQDNMGQALNLFYAKDGETWVRNGGEGPDYADISLYNLVRLIAREHPDIGVPSGSDDEIGDVICDLLMDGTETIAGIVALLYTAGWAFAELRARLKSYEDLCLTPEEISDLMIANGEKAAEISRLTALNRRAQPANEPLTLDELRGMDGEPVWCEDTTNYSGIIKLAEDWSTDKPEAHIWTFEEEGNPKCYNVRLMMEFGAKFYLRKPEGGAPNA